MSDTSGFFDLFQRSAWRLEVRPFYGPDADEFDRYQHDQPPTVEQERQRRHWLEHIAAATSDGRSVGRVLVVTAPLTPYWRWRVATGRAHAAAGEEIHLADRAQHPELAALTADFWLLDDARVLLLDYDPRGMFLGRREVTDPASVADYRRQQALSRRCSVPLEAFLHVTR